MFDDFDDVMDDVDFDKDDIFDIMDFVSFKWKIIFGLIFKWLLIVIKLRNKRFIIGVLLVNVVDFLDEERKM